MAETPPDPSPFDDVRAAFERLDFQDKVAFSIEAAFGALGTLVEETGRTFGAVLDDLGADLARAFEPPADEPPADEPG